MKFKVNDDTYTVEIFQDGNDVPFVHQPQKPNGEPWANAAEAGAWAQAVIDHHKDPENNEFPA